jgi:hypothetical protein
MANRSKELMRLAANGDISTFQAKAQKVLQAIEDDKQGHLAAIASLEEEERWVLTTIKMVVPSSAVNQTPSKATANPDSGVGEDGYTKKQRGQLIRDTALALASQGRAEVTIADILNDLAEKGVRFSIKRPQAAVAATVAAMKEFERTETRAFRYKGPGSQLSPLPLMESEEAH